MLFSIVPMLVSCEQYFFPSWNHVTVLSWRYLYVRHTVQLWRCGSQGCLYYGSSREHLFCVNRWTILHLLNGKKFRSNCSVGFEYEGPVDVKKKKNTHSVRHHVCYLMLHVVLVQVYCNCAAVGEKCGGKLFSPLRNLPCDVTPEQVDPNLSNTSWVPNRVLLYLTPNVLSA